MTQSPTPVILNFDDAIGDIPAAHAIPLQTWQESVRFGCRWAQFRRLDAALAPLLPPAYGCVFTGSGDYHHLTYLLLQRLSPQEKVQLIVCDNHPDNMRYPFGIHCGSWVYWASRLPWVKHVHVIGIGSGDISAAHAWENHWSPLMKGKLTYWSVSTHAHWLRYLGAGRAGRDFPDADDLMSAFLAEIDDTLPVYLSIDKDVLSPEVVNTNWDQGSFLEHHLDRLLDACAGRLIGADITGDVSAYRYRSRFKRWLSAADGQETPPDAVIAGWQQRQNALNLRLLGKIGRGWRR